MGANVCPATGTISTHAGTCGAAGAHAGNFGPATLGRLNGPTSISIDYTVSAGTRDGMLLIANLCWPIRTAQGGYLVADSANHVIRRVYTASYSQTASQTGTQSRSQSLTASRTATLTQTPSCTGTQTMTPTQVSRSTGAVRDGHVRALSAPRAFLPPDGDHWTNGDDNANAIADVFRNAKPDSNSISFSNALAELHAVPHGDWHGDDFAVRLDDENADAIRERDAEPDPDRFALPIANVIAGAIA